MSKPAMARRPPSAPLDALINRIRREHAAEQSREKHARRLAEQIAGCFLREIDAAAASMNVALAEYGLKFGPAREHRRWHYPKRHFQCDIDAQSFVVSLYEGGNLWGIRHAFFAVLQADDFLDPNSDGVTILVSPNDTPDANPREYCNQQDRSAVRLIIEQEMAWCAEPELRALITETSR